MKNIILFVLFTFSIAAFFAQDKPLKGKERQEKIKQVKIAYITEQLALTSAEAEKFWPIYNEMEVKIKNNRKSQRKIISELSNEANKEEDFKKKSLLLFENEQEMLVIKKEYHSKIAEVIGYKKATKLLKVEREFKEKLIQELKNRKNAKE
jgi:hypothetical protein